jgi:phosphatidylglycerol:prolipoprotein diacylglycerol transferase
MAGCCFGTTTHGAQALVFPPGSPPSDWQAREGLIPHHLLASLPVHPTQIYEAAAAFALSGFGILYLHARKRYDGQVFAMFVGGYGLARFLIEFFRSDDRGGVGLLSTSQWIALFMVFGAVLIHLKRGHGQSRPKRVTAGAGDTI